MNTERAGFRPEEDDEDESVVSFGQGPAFRPVPRVPRPRHFEQQGIKSAAHTPRLPEGILFQRHETAEKTPEIDEDDTEDREHRPKNMQAIVVEPDTPMQGGAHRPDVDRTFVNPIALEAKQGPPLRELAIDENAERTDENADAFRPIVYPEMPRLVSPQQRAEQAEESGASDPATEQQERVIVPPSEPDVAQPGNEAQFYPQAKPEWDDTRMSGFEAPFPEIHTATETPPPADSQDKYGYDSVPHKPANGGMPPFAGGGSNASPPYNPSGPGGGQPPNYNAYGGAGGEHNNPNVIFPAAPAQEGVKHHHTTIINKKGSLWPYAAVLAERFARRRADRKVSQQLNERMNEHERAAHADKMRFEQQQSRAADNQRRQAIREAHLPSGHEWGVPKPYPSQESGVVGGRSIPDPALHQEQVFYPGVAPEVPGHQYEQIQQNDRHNPPVNERTEGSTGAPYGHEFHHERRQETMTHNYGSSPSSNAGARPGGSAGTSAATAAGSYSHRLPSGMTSPDLPAGAPAHVDPQHQLPQHTKRAAPGPVFWLMLILIIAAFFAAALI